MIQGPKAFQRHFAEWRHAHGMRCLGIPNTAHFANVTQVGYSNFFCDNQLTRTNHILVLLHIIITDIQLFCTTFVDRGRYGPLGEAQDAEGR